MTALSELALALAATEAENAVRATDAPRDWVRWRAEREAALRETHGWLSLTGLHWLDAIPRELPGVPGRWWGDDDGVHVTAVACDGISVPGAEPPLHGTRTTAAAEAGSAIAVTFGGEDGHQVAVEAIRRTGRPGVRVRDSLAPARTGFTGAPTFPYDASWVIDAPVRWQSQPHTATVGASQPGLVHHVEVIGEVDVEHGGQRATLRLVGSRAKPALLFSDPTAQTAPWRVLHVAVPDDVAAGAPEATAATVRLDFNRTVNLPYAFSDFGTCPRPVDGNDLAFDVPAGEQAPR